MTPFQRECDRWLIECFDQRPVDGDPLVRVARFLEEAIELAQAMGLKKENVALLADQVYAKPPGEFSQELGGCLVTLALVASHREADLMMAGEMEVASAFQRIPQIREKSKLKAKIVR